MSKAKAPGIDPRSAVTTLTYTGDSSGFPHIGGIPARDLSDSDLARIAWARLGDDRPDAPLHVPADTVAALAAELVASGIYTLPATPATTED